MDPQIIAGGILKAFANSVDFTFLIAMVLVLLIAVAGVFYKAPLAPAPPHKPPFGKKAAAETSVSAEDHED